MDVLKELQASPTATLPKRRKVKVKPKAPRKVTKKTRAKMRAARARRDGKRIGNYNSKLEQRVLTCARCEGTGKVARPVALPDGVTLEQIAALTGKSVSMISRIFSAESDPKKVRWRKTVRELVQMAARLGMTVDELAATVLG